MSDQNNAYDALPADLKSKIIGTDEHHGQTALRCNAADQRALLENFRLSQNYDFLVDTTEKWCQERAVYLALLESISIHDGQDKNKTRDSIPGLLSEALGVSFDDHVGHDYLGDYEERYNFYHLKEYYLHLQE